MNRFLLYLWVPFVFGFMTGCIYSISVYSYISNGAVFRAFSIGEKKTALVWLVENRPFTEVLSMLRNMYPTQEPATHSIGHLLGDVAYERHGNKAFGMCDLIFNFGCYHGVVDSAVRKHGVDTSIVLDLYQACEGSMDNTAPCIHPLGHASAIVSNYSLPEAFALCDRLFPDEHIATDCWDGVMMEYINRSAPNAPGIPYGDVSDPYAPCDSVASKYQASCVSTHTSYLIHIWGRDYARVLSFCLSFSNDEIVNRCVDAMGSHIAQRYFDTPEAIFPLCEHAFSKKGWCVMGSIVPFLAADNDTQADDLCGLLTSEDRKRCTQRLRTFQAQ